MGATHWGHDILTPSDENAHHKMFFVAVTNTFLWWMFSLACHLLQLFNSVLVWQVPEGPCKQCHAYTVISLTVCIMIYASSSTIKTATLTVALCSIMHVVCMCMV